MKKQDVLIGEDYAWEQGNQLRAPMRVRVLRQEDREETMNGRTSKTRMVGGFVCSVCEEDGSARIADGKPVTVFIKPRWLHRPWAAWVAEVSNQRSAQARADQKKAAAAAACKRAQASLRKVGVQSEVYAGGIRIPQHQLVDLMLLIDRGTR